MKTHPASIKRVRLLIALFMLVLTLSGLTAIPLRRELGLLNQWFGMETFMSQVWPSMAEWIGRVNDSVQNGYGRYPLLAYGTDWLAFAHVVIAAAFIGPLRDPLKNVWVLEFGMIACVLLIPWAVIFGFIRDIPPFWTVIDISFGIFGLIPLWIVRRGVIELARA